MTPVECVIAAFGGVRKTAKALGRQPGAVILWRKRGLIPNALQGQLLEMAEAGRIALSAEEIIRGASGP